MTLNELIVKAKELKWPTEIGDTTIVLNAIPAGVQAIGYGLILRTYVKLVYNRPSANNIIQDESPPKRK